MAEGEKEQDGLRKPSGSRLVFHVVNGFDTHVVRLGQQSTLGTSPSVLVFYSPLRFLAGEAFD